LSTNSYEIFRWVGRLTGNKPILVLIWIEEVLTGFLRFRRSS